MFFVVFLCMNMNTCKTTKALRGHIAAHTTCCFLNYNVLKANVRYSHHSAQGLAELCVLLGALKRSSREVVNCDHSQQLT